MESDYEDGGLILVKASELRGMPIVSITEGEALADVRDVIYSPDEGRLLGFTLKNVRGAERRKGKFSGRSKASLGIHAVVAIGRMAVMVNDSSALASKARAGEGTSGSVHNNNVLTENGSRLGEVTDLVVEVGVVEDNSTAAGAVAAGDVVGYEILADPSLPARQGAEPGDRATLFIPLPYTLSVSGENLIVPESVGDYIRDDLAGFSGAVDDFRANLPEESA